MNLASCDIETSCGVKDCPGYGGGSSHEEEGQGKCKHALHHKLNKIDIIGVYDGREYLNFASDIAAFNAWYTRSDRPTLIFHGGKFDYKTLREKGAKIGPSNRTDDTMLMGAAVLNKVTDKWLEIYNEKRMFINEKLPKGVKKHRVGTPLSLKTMAPYYLKVLPFWENVKTHNDEEYNKKDCIYTYGLAIHLRKEMQKDGTTEFYEKYLIPWQKLLAEAEFEGVLIDEDKLHEMYAEAQKELVKIEEEVHRYVSPCFKAYRNTLIKKIEQESKTKCDNFIQKRIKNSDKQEGVKARYAERLKKRIDLLPTRFNLESSQQVLHILTWAGIDTLIEKRDKESNEWLETEGTNKFVLKRAKVCHKNDFAGVLLKYREKETEVSYLKQYINATVGGRIYCTFNLTGTRTGRLSASNPNLQNIKGVLRHPFIVADPAKYLVYTVDSSQIEPRMIAYLTEDAAMVKLFQEGRDYHNYATHLFFPETRSTPENLVKDKFKELRNNVAKHGDLSIIYGTGAFTLKNMVLVRGERDVEHEKCEEWVQEFRRGMKTVMGWKRGLEDEYKRGVKIFDKFGFPVTARDRSSVHMTLFNTYVQGFSSRSIFHASLMAYREFCKLKIDAKPLMWVHDEVVWRFPKDKAEFCKKVVDKYMTGYKLETRHGRVPLACEGKIDDRWCK